MMNAPRMVPQLLVRLAVMTLATASVAAAGEADLNVGERLPAPRAGQGDDDSWLHQRRSEQVKALVRDVLADADTRASFAEGDSLTAGHDGRFFLASADGRHRLNIGGQIQFRYVASFRNQPEVGRAGERGFQHRRTRLNFTGHVFDPRLTFQIQPEFRRDDGSLGVANLNLAWQLADGLAVTVGRIKPPFLKEEMHSSSRQLAVERSAVNNVFSGVWTTGVELAWTSEPLLAFLQVNNGFQADPRSFADRDATARVGITGRLEARLAGDWRQQRDFIAWNRQPLGLFLGAAAHYEDNRTDRFTGPFAHSVNFATWTVDVAAYYANFSAFAAFVGRHDTRPALDAEKFDDHGLLLQAAHNLDDRLAPFVRYEWLMPAPRRDVHDIHLIGGGVNYYLHGHAAKLTTDVVWALNSLSGFYSGSEGLGLLPDAPASRRQLALRVQVQLLF